MDHKPEFKTLLTKDFFRAYGNTSARVKKLVSEAVSELGYEKFCSLVETHGAPFDPHRARGKKADTDMENWKRKIAEKEIDDDEDGSGDLPSDLKPVEDEITINHIHYGNWSDQISRENMILSATTVIRTMPDIFGINKDSGEDEDDYYDDEDDGDLLVLGNDESENEDDIDHSKRRRGLWHCHIVIRNTLTSLESYFEYLKEGECIGRLSNPISGSENLEEKIKTEFDLISTLMEEVISYKRFINEGVWRVYRNTSFEDGYLAMDEACSRVIQLWQKITIELHDGEKNDDKK